MRNGDGNSPSSIGEPVTPDAQMTERRSWKFLACGIDTLDIGFFVEWNNWKWLENQLSIAKAKAITAKSDGALIDLGVSEMIANPTGKPPMYQFGLTTPDYRLWIAARATPGEFPNVYVSPLASMLWMQGIDATIEQLTHDIEAMGGTVEAIRVSRVDPCADFHIPGGLTDEWIEHHRVSRSKGIRTHRDGPMLHTFQIGRGKSPIQLRIYDKTAEIEQSGKAWVRQVWPSGSITEVWRFEYQIRREALRQFKIHTPGDLINRVSTLWEYLTTTWFSLRAHDSCNTTRRTFCLLWIDVQQVANELPGAIEVNRSKEPTNADLTRIVQQVLGYAKSYAAVMRITDRDQALQAMVEEISQIITPGDFTEAVQKRAIRAGVSLGVVTEAEK